MGPSTRLRGFTLLEAMIALVIVSLGMMAVNTQLNRYVVSAAFIEQKTLASWIASNKLTEMSVDPQWPALGTTEGDEEFAQRLWIWQAEVSETPLENLRRVDVTVSLAEDPTLEIHAMSAFLEPPPPPGFPAVTWLTVGNGAGYGSGAGARRRGTGAQDAMRVRKAIRISSPAVRVQAGWETAGEAQQRIHTGRVTRRDGRRRGHRRYGARRFVRGDSAADDCAGAR